MEKRKKKDEIVYRTVKETIRITKKDVDEKWIKEVKASRKKDANQAKKEKRHCLRLDIADEDERDEWTASHDDDPFFNLCVETPEEEANRLHYAISKLNEEQQRLIDQIFFKGYSHKQVAEMEGVTRQAIEKRLKKSLAELKSFF